MTLLIQETLFMFFRTFGQSRCFYTVLYYTILYCTTLYCIILYYTILYYATLHYTVLYYTIYYNLNLKYPSLVHVFEHLVPSYRTVLKGCEAFGMGGLTSRSGSLGTGWLKNLQFQIHQDVTKLCHKLLPPLATLLHALYLPC